MSFFLTLVLASAAGLAWLRALRLETRTLAVDLALGWFVGGAWFGLAVAALRFLVGLAYTIPLAMLVIAAPFIAWGARALLAPRSRAPRTESASSSRWRPRPGWLFVPLAAYVMVMAYATATHGIVTPTNTDDGLRVRALTPILAFEDRWNGETRQVLALAGSLPTWTPSLAWRLTGRVDHFHVNYTVVSHFLGLLVLLVSLAASRGFPERGWVGAFAVLSLPLFVYHCTSTYTDAVLAIHVGIGFLFFLEYDRARDPRDAQRALLFFVLASFVKREGGTVAACAALPLVMLLLWRRRHDASIRIRSLLLLLSPVLLDLATAVSSVGMVQAFPVTGLLANAAQATPPSSPPVSELRLEAAQAFHWALLRSGNQGMLYWILAATALMRLPFLVRSGRCMPFLSVASLFALSVMSSIWLIPQYTLDQSTVHRALLVVSVPASLWVVATLSEWCSEKPAAE